MLIKINGMLNQAYKIEPWGKNVYVKIPVINSKGLFMGSVIKELSNKGVKLNITAVYTHEQVKNLQNSKSKNQNYYFYICRKNG